MTSIWRHIIAMLTLTGSVSCLQCDESRVSGEVERIIFDCSLRNISRLPVFVPSRATHLHLERNTIVVVPENAFPNLPNLTLLDLSFNKINTLGKMCFVGLRQLQKLNLHGNNLDLSHLPKNTFTGLPYLQVLAIAGQGTATGNYPVSILDGLTQLQTLSVRAEDSPLPEDYGQLPKLNTLDLIGGEIRTVNVHTLSALQNSNIITLIIRRGSITHIEAGVFTDFTNLRVLNLNCNSKLNVRQAIASLGHTVNSSIDTIILDNIDPGSFGILDIRDFCSVSHFWSRIRRLSLRDVRLSMFYARDMLCISDIEELYLSHNPFNGVMPRDADLLSEFRQLSKLRVIDISYLGNADTRMTKRRCSDGCDLGLDVDDYLPSYPRLQSFPLNVDKPVPLLPNLTTCDKQKTVFLPPELRFLEASQCSSSARNILNNRCIVSSDNNLLYLNISGVNAVRHLQGFVVGLTKLQVLDLSHGMLKSIGENTVRFYSSLRVLNIAHNDLGKGQTPYGKVFTFSHRLEIIDLSHNDIRHIHSKTFSTCTQLQPIKLGNNKFDDMDLQIEGLTSLNLIDLSGNMLPFLSPNFMKELDKLTKQRHSS